MSSSRQLAAIMFTDIVGYTALMGNDEQKAFQVLDQSRQIQKPIILKYNGKWIKELGDGVMASFTTVSDAVHAAIEIQRSCNATDEFKLRIGIHLGEVVFEDGDVFGDGVNVASRIQSAAYPGSIFISEAVQKSLSNKKEFQSRFFKEEKLKNVREPVKVFQVIEEGVTTATLQLSQKIPRSAKLFLFVVAIIGLCSAGYLLMTRKSPNAKAADEKSIAILPFTDLSPEKNQEYLGDGLADEIINSISIIKNVKVIGSTSSFKFRKEKLAPQAIGKMLNVSNVLEGSIQKSGDVIRIITKLVRVSDNRTLWSKRFENSAKDIFAIQDTIASRIVEALAITLTENEKPRLIKKETDPEVYSLYLKALYTYKAEEFVKSIDYNLQANQIDSQFAPSYAYIGLAKTWKVYRSNALFDVAAIREAKDFATHSIRLDPNLAEGYSALALLAWTLEVDFAAAKVNFEKSLSLNPSAPLIKNRYGYFLLWMGEFEKAEKLALEAIELDPADFNGYLIVAHANLYKKNFRTVDKYLTEGQKLFPTNAGFKNVALHNNFLSGKYNDIIRTLAPLVENDSDRVPSGALVLLSASYFKNGNLPESKKIFNLILEKYNDRNSDGEYALAKIYAQYRQIDSCFYRLERSLANREREFRLMKIDPLLDPIRKDPRYFDLYRRYGFDRYK